VARSADAEAFFSRVYELVSAIPRGQVMTYGTVAALLGNPRGARAVGWALRALRGRQAHRVPWQRVVGSGGRISVPGESGIRQRRLLRSEGVRFRGAVVDMARHFVPLAVTPGRASRAPRRISGRT
jgi:methylated-DNA-protein-cysteine methyltransferase-like protein